MAMICDIDNTLVTSGVKPMIKTIAKVNADPEGAYLITGRLEAERGRTVQMLHSLGINYKELLMNRYGSDPAGQLKSKNENAQLVMQHADITTAIDDDPSARLLYKKLGIPNVTGP